jgi:hypothetical protein
MLVLVPVAVGPPTSVITPVAEVILVEVPVVVLSVIVSSVAITPREERTSNSISFLGIELI